MPLYDYKCPTCGIEFEQIAKAEDKVVPCKKCGKDAKQQLSATNAFRLYGEGFHKRTHRDSGEFSG